jgi:hypothetical protein
MSALDQKVQLITEDTLKANVINWLAAEGLMLRPTVSA